MVNDAWFNLAANSPASLWMYPAAQVLTGSVTANSWISDTTLITTTNTS